MKKFIEKLNLTNVQIGYIKANYDFFIFLKDNYSKQLFLNSRSISNYYNQKKTDYNQMNSSKKHKVSVYYILDFLRQLKALKMVNKSKNANNLFKKTFFYESVLNYVLNQENFRFLPNICLLNLLGNCSFQCEKCLYESKLIKELMIKEIIK